MSMLVSVYTDSWQIKKYMKRVCRESQKPRHEVYVLMDDTDALVLGFTAYQHIWRKWKSSGVCWFKDSKQLWEIPPRILFELDEPMGCSTARENRHISERWSRCSISGVWNLNSTVTSSLRDGTRQQNLCLNHFVCISFWNHPRWRCSSSAFGVSVEDIRLSVTVWQGLECTKSKVDGKLSLSLVIARPLSYQSVFVLFIQELGKRSTFKSYVHVNRARFEIWWSLSFESQHASGVTSTLLLCLFVFSDF